jgi:hypothetical protein
LRPGAPERKLGWGWQSDEFDAPRGSFAVGLDRPAVDRAYAVIVDQIRAVT